MPPKKDAFADLFSSASGGKQNNLTMLEKQRQQQQQRASQNSSLSSLQAPKQDSWSNLDFLSNASTRTTSPNLPQQNFQDILNPSQSVGSKGASPSVPGSGVSTTNSSTNSFKKTEDDPFAIFNAPQPKLNRSNGSNASSVSHGTNAAANPNIGGLSLLDDEFTDVFPESKKQEPVVEVPQPSRPSRPTGSSRSSFSDSGPSFPSRPTSSQRQSNSSSKAELSRKDSIVAELVDIGFSIEDANFAVSKKGLDLQGCVNFIMNKNSGDSTPRREQSRSKPTEGLNFNEIGVDFFNRANKFLAKSKDTVIKNIEQFQKQGSNNGSPNLPEWMRDHEKYEKYKSEAVEKKYGNGEAELDYGSDSENVNQDEIERFMRLQKEKEKERSKKRYEDLRGAALNKIRGNSRDSESQSPVRRQQTPTRPPRPIEQDEPIRRRPVRPIRKADSPPVPQAQEESFKSVPLEIPQQAKPKPAPKAEPKEDSVDLLGISSSQSGPSSLTSSLRINAPLNQFDEVDYTTAKTTAQEAYRTGDYTGALESYLICLNKLPNNHENRVVIFSNLGMVNKQVGHLKQSLENIEGGLALISDEEVHNSGFTISQKPVKYWYTKLVTTKAEVLELSEKYELSLKFYSILIKDLGVTDKKIMDGKRRVDKIVNPDNYKVKPAAKTTPRVSKSPSPAVKKAPVEESQIDPLAQDKINMKVQQWSQSKQGNLRSLLAGLDVIIPSIINMKPALRNLTTNELMLPKQVKIQYMKVISSIHPDKLASQCKDNKEAELICNGVFIILNESWEKFKAENSL